MNWEKLDLRQSKKLRFQKGVELTVSFYLKPKIGEIDEEITKIDFPEGMSINLKDVADNSETTDYPYVFAIYGKIESEIFLFGGCVAYLIDDKGNINKTLKLFRDKDIYEYWYSQILNLERKLIFIYETGALLLDETMDVKWHIQKYINDFYHEIDGDKIVFLRDHEERWSISLQEGKPSY